MAKVAETTEIERIEAKELKARVDRGEPIIFVDARAPKEWEATPEKIPGAIRVPLDEVALHLDRIPRGQAIVVYCT